MKTDNIEYRVHHTIDDGFSVNELYVYPLGGNYYQFLTCLQEMDLDMILEADRLGQAAVDEFISSGNKPEKRPDGRYKCIKKISIPYNVKKGTTKKKAVKK